MGIGCEKTGRIFADVLVTTDTLDEGGVNDVVQAGGR
jgi:hypothetical protein